MNNEEKFLELFGIIENKTNSLFYYSVYRRETETLILL